MKPSSEKTSFQMLSLVERRPIPKIIISKAAMKWMAALVDIHPLEVGWYGVVDERQDGSFFVRDILYPKHSEMESTTCEISPEGEADMMELLFEEGREEDIAKAKLFWGHSHHTMGTSPSQQDESQAMSIMKESQNMCIRAICNKRGEMNISVFDYKNSVRFDHVPFSVEGGADKDEVIQERLTKISSILSGSETGEKKLDEISKALTDVPDSEREETNQIRKWVEDLKKINTPEKKYGGRQGPYQHNYSVHNNKTHYKQNGSKKKEKKHQSNMFPTLYQDDFEDPVPPNDFRFPGDMTYEENVEDVLSQFDLYRDTGRFNLD